jgi:acyl-CoA thioesterase
MMLNTEGLFAINKIDDDYYQAFLNSAIGVFGRPNGGYMLGLAAKALCLRNADQQLISITCYFMSAPVNLDKPMDIHLSLLKKGSTTSFWSIDVTHDNRHCLRITAVMAGPQGFSEQHYMQLKAPAIDAADNCHELPMPAFSKGLAEAVCYKMPSEAVQKLQQLPNDLTEFNMWMGLRDQSQIEAWHVLFLMDAMMPPIFLAKGMTGWVPTLELTVQLRGSATSSLVQCHFASKALTNGILEEDGQMWDANGHLIALSRQSSIFKPQPMSP